MHAVFFFVVEVVGGGGDVDKIETVDCGVVFLFSWRRQFYLNVWRVYG